MRAKLPRFSSRDAPRLSAERVRLAERYTIDAEEAEARAVAEARKQAAHDAAELARQEAQEASRLTRKLEAAERASQIGSLATGGAEAGQVEQPSRAPQVGDLTGMAKVGHDEDLAAPDVRADENLPARDLPIYAWFDER